MMDYLAEVSMSLLARAKMKDPSGGFPPDFIGYLKPHLGEIARRGIKVVSNAGGVNPKACQAAMQAACDEAGVSLNIAAVEGDDVLPYIDALRAQGVREAVSDAELPPRLLTANAYLGALPIKAALDRGADIVITGRCADSALALGILMHEFGWAADDYDRCRASAGMRRPGGRRTAHRLGEGAGLGQHRLSDRGVRGGRRLCPDQARQHRRPGHPRRGGRADLV
jgi:hypothetical protein